MGENLPLLILLVFLVIVVIFVLRVLYQIFYTRWLLLGYARAEEWFPVFWGNHQKIFEFLLREEDEVVKILLLLLKHFFCHSHYSFDDASVRQLFWFWWHNLTYSLLAIYANSNMFSSVLFNGGVNMTQSIVGRGVRSSLYIWFSPPFWLTPILKLCLSPSKTLCILVL